MEFIQTREMGMIPQFKSAVLNMFNAQLDKYKDSSAQLLELNVLSNDTLLENKGLNLDGQIHEGDIHKTNKKITGIARSKRSKTTQAQSKQRSQKEKTDSFYQTMNGRFMPLEH